jgi:hypothetical protein
MADNNIVLPELNTNPDAPDIPQGTVAQNTGEQEVDLQALNKEISDEVQYGDRPVEALAGSLLSAGTGGLSDVIFRAAGVPAERLREPREREPIPSAIGTTIGVVGPILATGGASALAQGAATTAKLSAAAGLATERALLKAAPKAAESLVARGIARGAGEGALQGLGQTVSNIALEKADLSAEALASGVLEGAAVGGLFGGTFGAGERTIKFLAKPKAKKSADEVAGFWKSVSRPLVDPTEMALRASTVNPTVKLRLEYELGDYADDLAKYWGDELIPKDAGFARRATFTPYDVYKTNEKTLERVGKEIADVVNTLDNAVATRAEFLGEKISKESIYRPIFNKLDETFEKFAGMPESNAGKLKVINKFRSDIAKMAVNSVVKDKPIDLSGLTDLKRFLYTFKYVENGPTLANFKADLALELSNSIRKSIDDIAAKFDSVQPGIGTRLKELNRQYTIGSRLEPFLKERSSKQVSITEPINLLRTMVPGAYRNVMLSTKAIEKAEKLTERIAESIRKMPEKSGPRKLPKGWAGAATATMLSIGDNGQKPKNRDEAFTNISQNVQKINNNPDFMVEVIARKTGPMAEAQPEIAAQMQETVVRGARFLQQKLPKPAINPGLFERPYKPSSMEMAKFERYLQAIEQPLSVLEELKSGTLTREHVEAIAQVYPAMYAQMRLEALKYVASTPNVSYERKLQLGILLNIPADSSLTPSSVMMLQASISGGTEPQESLQDADSSIRAKGMDQVDISGRAETDVQEVEADE